MSVVSKILMGRLSSVAWLIVVGVITVSVHAQEQNVRYVYDQKGRLVSVAYDQASGMKYGYDKADNLESFTVADDASFLDTDGDGLTDAEEAELGTSATEKDSDGDGISDSYEHQHELNPIVSNEEVDSDGDGIYDVDEYKMGTNPMAKDSDEDGIEDNDEISIYHTDPLNSDSDNDGLTDGVEVDGISCGEEVNLALNGTISMEKASWYTIQPINDGINDVYANHAYGPINAPLIIDLGDVYEISSTKEYLYDQTATYKYKYTVEYLTDENIPQWVVCIDKRDQSYCSLQETTFVPAIRTRYLKFECTESSVSSAIHIKEWEIYGQQKVMLNPNAYDTDGDGLSDGEEVNIYETDPVRKDTDDDGLSDLEELMVYHTDPNKADSDGDGLSDIDELNQFGTSPVKDDTDDDGLTDDMEISGSLELVNLLQSDAWVRNNVPADGNESYAYRINDQDYNTSYFYQLNSGNEIEVIFSGKQIVQRTCLFTYEHAGRLYDYSISYLGPNGEWRYIESDKLTTDSGCDVRIIEPYIYTEKIKIKALGTSEGVNNPLLIHEFECWGSGSIGTSANNPDTDGDGMPDGWEFWNGLDPLNPDDARVDSDSDFLCNLGEYLFDTNPRVPNSNGEEDIAAADEDGDGMSNDWEIRNGFDPMDGSDAYEDPYIADTLYEEIGNLKLTIPPVYPWYNNKHWYDVNEAGCAVGCFYRYDNGPRHRAVCYMGNETIELTPLLSGTGGAALDINDQNQIVGVSWKREDPSSNGSSYTCLTPFLFDNGVVHEYDEVFAGHERIGFERINNNGQILAVSYKEGLYNVDQLCARSCLFT